MRRLPWRYQGRNKNLRQYTGYAIGPFFSPAHPSASRRTIPHPQAKPSERRSGERHAALCVTCLLRSPTGGDAPCLCWCRTLSLCVMQARRWLTLFSVLLGEKSADVKAYKPDSVPRRSRPLRLDDHFSGIRVASNLKRPTRRPRPGQSVCKTRKASYRCLPIWPCTGRRLPCR